MDHNFILYKKSQSFIRLLYTLLHIFYYNHILLQFRFQNVSLHKPNTRGKGQLTVHSTTYAKCDWFCVSSIYIIENTNKAIFYFYWNIHLQQQTSSTSHTYNSLQRTLFCYGKTKYCNATAWSLLCILGDCIFHHVWATAWCSEEFGHKERVKKQKSKQKLTPAKQKIQQNKRDQ